MTLELVAVPMEDGTTAEVPPALADTFRGFTEGGFLVVEAEWKAGYMMALTDCCNATGKGSQDGYVVCRSCYMEVDELVFADEATITLRRAA